MISNYVKFEVLSEFSNHKKDLINELLDTFKQQVPETIKKLREYIHDKNWERVSALSHKLKSGFKLLGIESAVDLSVYIELKAKNGESDEMIAAKALEMERIVDIAIVEINNYQDK